MTFLKYLKSRRWFLLLLLLCSINHIVVLSLYGYDTEPIWYAVVIYLFLVLVCGVLDYGYQKRKCKRLCAYDAQIDDNLSELVETGDAIEEEYQRIIRKISMQQAVTKNEYMQRERDLSDFYTMWVHQIKTPIAALQLLMQTAPENISGMKGELFKIERYVDIILNYLRMEDMNKDIMLKHYSLEPLVKQAVKKYTPLFIQSRLSLNLEDLEYEVLTDEKWLVFVCEQLISNAIKYTKTGGITISVQVWEEGEVKKTSLIIEDTGIGINPEDLPRIYERAFTGYNGRNDKKASGLGLYLCKTILQKLGHEIAITSIPQTGTCVTITFIENMELRGNLTNL